MVEPVVRLERVCQTFATRRGAVPAVADVDLDLFAGKVTCLVGESGSGKTSTARIVAGLATPTSGRVLFDGADIGALGGRERERYRLSVQYVHQDPYASLNPTRTVRSALMAPLRRNGLVKGRAAAVARCHDLLAKVDLTPPHAYLDKYPHQLSGGQRQRASIARALATGPKLIVADEATSMLDVSIRISLLNMLGSLRDDLGVAFLFITHDLAQAKYFGWDGDIAVMYLGRIVERGPTQDVLTQASHPYTRALLEAIPEPDPDVTRRKHGVQLREAGIPSLLAIPPGCPFHPRCPVAEQGTCDSVPPELTPVTSSVPADHAAACVRLAAVPELMPITATAGWGRAR
jgi:oligopeptide/dipeptide ABC transporter ATP-binding protein